MSATSVERIESPVGVSAWPPYPTSYEINTWVWLTELSHKYGGNVDLSSVPSAEWDAIAAYGFDSVWLMGVWERSPAGIAIANQNKSLLDDFRRALPDYSVNDNVGSPYCVRRYVVDAHLGGPAGLATARRELSRRGMNLILDFVPNHVAPDHPWVREHPEFFIQGSVEDARNNPASYVTVNETVFACGRDPFFPAWPDVLQLNAFQAGLRRGRDSDHIHHRATVRRHSLRHGNADVEPGLRSHLARPRWTAACNRILGRCHHRREEESSRVPLYCRSLLGSGVGTPATRFRFLLRQETLRPPRARQC